MKKIALFTAILGSSIAYAVEPTSSISAIQLAKQKQLAQQTTWQRLMYADAKGQSEVSYAGYFLTPEGGKHLQAELNANVAALFEPAAANQSVRCRFPARSQWLIKQLNIPNTALPNVECPELDKWLGEIKPYKATLIYATDFMGNPSSMFGHTLLRLDPKDQKQLNLVSYAVNYAATVAGADGWSFAWKGLTGQYPGEYSLMPYYRKVKEYGDLESRDLWEYELNLNPDETRFLVQHIWEMQHVSFPYYFVSDNCAYRLLGLIDLVRPELNLKQQFKVAAIPMQTIKAIDQQGIVSETVYRPALETQLLAQARQHGQALAKTAHQVAFAEQKQRAEILAPYTEIDRAKILEMAYDDLYLQFVARKVDVSFAQPNLRELLTLRSAIDLDKQRQAPERPRMDPTQSHDARNFSLKAGQVQGDNFIELSHRQAYHDLIDPQGGYRVGTQLLFWDGAVQVRDDELKLEHFDFLTVNSYNPITAFKTPLTWGFNLGWQQEALTSSGQFSSDDQHGVVSLKTQMGYSYADAKRENLCYAQMQTYLQGGKSLDKGWRIGLGPTLGCQNIWTERINSIVQVELPYWEDAHAWQLRLNSQLQYAFNTQNAVRVAWEYQSQDHQDWNKFSLGYVRFF
ncbi:Lnb N-terminal periplasmic domain-containing protein [Acinetobacter sp. GXMZU3951]